MLGSVLNCHWFLWRVCFKIADFCEGSVLRPKFLLDEPLLLYLNRKLKIYNNVILIYSYTTKKEQLSGRTYLMLTTKKLIFWCSKFLFIKNLPTSYMLQNILIVIYELNLFSFCTDMKKLAFVTICLCYWKCSINLLP